tara:strand:+ start:258 stop:458 length:201 start_codon:yes stop_codon:yes gene_type:complete
MNNCEETLTNLKILNGKIKQTNYKMTKDIKRLKINKYHKDNDYYKTSLNLRSCLENILNYELNSIK